MKLEGEQEIRIINPFHNPLEFWQKYLINWIQASRGIYENTIKANEYWFKVFWDPWLRTSRTAQKE
jgi:hypothetical protein